MRAPPLGAGLGLERRHCRTSRQRLTIFGDGSLGGRLSGSLGGVCPLVNTLGDGSLGGRLSGSLAGVCPLVNTLGDGSLGGRAVHVEAHGAQHIVAAGRALPAAFRVRVGVG